MRKEIGKDSNLDETVILETSTANENSSSEDTDFEPPVSFCINKSPQNKSPGQSMGKLAIACDRVGISHRAAATIATAAFDDHFGGDEFPVIDKSKIFREREKARSLSATSFDTTEVESIYF